MLGRTALALLIALQAQAVRSAEAVPADAARLKLERVVIVQRHGVRSPTQRAEVLGTWAARPWPAWDVPPGELTAHGGRVVELVARSLGDEYRSLGLLPASCVAARRASLIWADGKDKRTRDSGRFMAMGLLPDCATPQVKYRTDNDPVFDSIAGDCKLDPAQARDAVRAALGPQDLVDPPTRAALDAIQQAMAPAACSGGAGLCLGGASEIGATPERIDIKGPLPAASEIAEIFLLQYAQGMPPEDVAWGEGHSTQAIARFMAAHERADKFTRQLEYVARRRGARMAQLILDTLNASATRGQPRVDRRVRVLALAGHDTNLSNMAGVFGLDWRLRDQPDSTAPATALAFELWRDARTRQALVKARVFHLTLDQMRELQPPGAQATALSFGRCPVGRPDGLCPLRELTRAVGHATPAACKAVSGGREQRAGARGPRVAMGGKRA